MQKNYQNKLEILKNRKPTLFTSTISGDKEGELYFLGEPFLEFLKKRSFFQAIGSLWLGKKRISKETEEFIKTTLTLLLDHGPYVSGAVNTIISARAGKDLASSICSGILTIGKRFGGAINDAASVFFNSVSNKKTPQELVSEFSKNKKYIPGIGHRKYRIDIPDKRVQTLLKIAKKLEKHPYLDFAKQVEKLTTQKKPNLILNIDGAIAALGLDILQYKENLSKTQIKKLIEIEFFNAFFVAARIFGFIAHFFDQKRLNENIFRLKEEDVLVDFNLPNEHNR